MSNVLNIESKGLIYLIDDDLSFAVSLAGALQLEGFTVIHFLGVMEFLNSDVDRDAIIISDMRMPKLTGLDLQSALKERRLSLPIIFVSGESTVNQAVSALKGGAVDFITKPFDPEKLIYIVSKTIQDRRAKKSIKDPSHLLSPREYEAFSYFVQGFENAYVADHMKIKISTVKEFKMNIMKKLNVKTMSELISKYRD